MDWTHWLFVGGAAVFVSFLLAAAAWPQTVTSRPKDPPDHVKVVRVPYDQDADV